MYEPKAHPYVCSGGLEATKIGCNHFTSNAWQPPVHPVNRFCKDRNKLLLEPTLVIGFRLTKRFKCDEHKPTSRPSDVHTITKAQSRRLTENKDFQRQDMESIATVGTSCRIPKGSESSLGLIRNHVSTTSQPTCSFEHKPQSSVKYEPRIPDL